MTAAPEAAEQRRRELDSAVKRLRAAARSDPARTDELADALVALVANRLLAWSFAEAAAVAPESVVLAARILAGRGSSGPYASLDEAVRYFTASAQLAAVQAGLGQVEAAGRTLDALDAWRGQLGSLPLVERLTPAGIVWAQSTRARARVATDVAQANAYADAAQQRLYAAGLDLEVESAYLAVASHLVVADCRWAAGQVGTALAHHQLALARYRAGIDGADATRSAVAQGATAPLAELFGSFAGRLEASGDRAGALGLLREWVVVAERFAGAGSGEAGVTAARAALGRALVRAGRKVEAEAMAAAAAEAAAEASLPAPGLPVGWSPLPSGEALAGSGLSVTASVRLQRDEQTAIAELAAARAAAEATEAQLRARAERAAAERAAERAEAEHRAARLAEQAAREAAEQARIQAEAEAERRAAAEVAEQAAAEARRRERAVARERAVDPEQLREAVDALPEARRRLAAAGTDLARLAVAQERLTAVLRPLAAAEPTRYRDDLVTALESLVSLRWRLGDADGSREAARELKTW
ncbi:MAG: hypothetical protein VB093_08145 [Propionicimonas sp.]|nr:hypothetical protein [Propionicimonas sp.]